MLLAVVSLNVFISLLLVLSKLSCGDVVSFVSRSVNLLLYIDLLSLIVTGSARCLLGAVELFCSFQFYVYYDLAPN